MARRPGSMGSRPRGRPGLAVACLLCCAAQASAQDAPPGAVVTTPVGDHQIAVRELVRIGTVDGAGPDRFGRVTDLAVEAGQDEVYVLDELDHAVKVFSTRGAFLRSWGRRGDGPGELQGPFAIAAAADTVVVIDGQRAHVFTRAGVHVATISLRTALPVAMAESIRTGPEGWTVVMREVEPGVTGTWPFRRTYRMKIDVGLDGRWIHQGTHPGPGPLGVMGHRPVSAASGGTIVEAPTAAYELRVHGPEGGEPRILRFQDRPVPVPASVRRDFEAALRERCRAGPGTEICLSRLEARLDEVVSQPVPAHRPVVGALVGSPEGRLLVQRADLDPTPFQPGDETGWDLVDVAGAWLGRVVFPARFTPLRMLDGEVWGVHLDGYDVPYVVGFALADR